MQLVVRISCASFPRPDGLDNHGDNAIRLASALRTLAAEVERSADDIRPGFEWGIYDSEEHPLGGAAYRLVDPV